MNLTLEIVEQFPFYGGSPLDPDEPLDLDEVTSIEDAAAAELADNFYSTDLYLSGLTSLSDAAAQALAQHEGDLWLRGDAHEAVRQSRLKLE